MKATMIRSIRPLILELGSCGLSALQTSIWEDDPAIVCEPGQANLLIVAGRIPPAFCPFLSALYAQLAAPKWVIAYGTCATSGAVFDTVSVQRVIPVDTYITGCPPYPDMLRDALTSLARQRKK